MKINRHNSVSYSLSKNPYFLEDQINKDIVKSFNEDLFNTLRLHNSIRSFDLVFYNIKILYRVTKGFNLL